LEIKFSQYKLISFKI